MKGFGGMRAVGPVDFEFEELLRAFVFCLPFGGMML